jgi:CBS domain-containing protein
MATVGNALRMRIYIGDFDQWHHRPLYEALVMMAKREGLAGATVFKGIAGFGAHSKVHTASIVRLSEDLPILVEFVDQPERIEHIRPFVDAMVREGLVTIDPVEVIIYRSRELRSLPAHLLVRDIMQQAAPIRPHMSAVEVMNILADGPASVLPVVEEESGRILGVVTNTDLIEKAGMPLRSRVLRALRAQGQPLPEESGVMEALSAAEVMATPATVIGAEEPAWEAADRLATTGLRALPVVDGQARYLGMLRRSDVLRSISDTLVGSPMEQGTATVVARTGRIGEIMRTDVPTVRPTTSLPEILDVILLSPIHRVFVTDDRQRLLGIIGDADLVQRLHPEAHHGLLQRFRGARIGEREVRALSHQTAEDVMHREVVTISPDAPLAEAMTLMLDRHVRLLPVTDGQGRLVGFVARDTMLVALVRSDRGDDPSPSEK